MLNLLVTHRCLIEDLVQLLEPSLRPIKRLLQAISAGVLLLARKQHRRQFGQPFQ